MVCQLHLLQKFVAADVIQETGFLMLEVLQGVLLYGPPGTGKTLLARAVAHHTECTFIRVSGSELVQKFIGEGARMVRELFVMAREHAPSIIFMDEIDSIGSSRVEGSSGGG
ncbi:26S protease regulatory subunit 8 [Toxocara canis]|uniref:26S protease regulatory subunit 8 n=1 Tax=Toxocara canis TaxID=6265 RepID=A0A0B2UR06_TOXCA|nr:26S protease regulatory subunit 8 [Toxocara canis]